MIILIYQANQNHVFNWTYKGAKTYYYSPSTDAGTAKATAACILILKLEESRNSSKRILKTDGALLKE